MMKIFAATFLLSSSIALAQQAPVPVIPAPEHPEGQIGSGVPAAHGRAHTKLRREDGQPSDDALMRISRQCHRGGANANPVEAKKNCFYIDQRVKARANEAGASDEIKSRAAEVAQ